MAALNIPLPEIQQQQFLSEALAHTQADRNVALLHFELRHRPHAPHGDPLVALMAHYLAPLMREHDLLFQIDNQSLGLLLANVAGVSHTLLAANRALALLSETPEPAVRLHPHIGIAVYPEHADNMSDLLHCACIAAREFVQDHIGVYDPNRDWLGNQIARLEGPIREALTQNRFHLAFQPKVCPQKQQVLGCEILLRWDHPSLGNVPPDQIVNVAEHLGLMDALTRWVVQSGLRQFAELRTAGFMGTVSINLCPSNLSDPSLAAFIDNALAVWGVPAHLVILEITESALIDDIDSALRQLHELKAMGCQLSLDDFGTGYSSLSYLKRLPIDELKIDRSFIQTITTSSKDAAIVQTIIELAHRLDLIVTAEGVEEEAGLALLQSYGCDLIQGYYYSRPLLPAAFQDYFKRYQ